MGTYNLSKTCTIKHDLVIHNSMILEIWWRYSALNSCSLIVFYLQYTSNQEDGTFRSDPLTFVKQQDCCVENKLKGVK